jgi:nitrite reductase/ring-hydroxylating ferredoxin subunit
LLHKVFEASELLPGGLKAVSLGGEELVIANCANAFYAVSRTCGHAHARMERGALTGWIITCPLHYAQFDVRTGEALSGPVPPKGLSTHPDPKDPALHTACLRTRPVVLKDGAVFVDLP